MCTFVLLGVVLRQSCPCLCPTSERNGLGLPCPILQEIFAVPIYVFVQDSATQVSAGWGLQWHSVHSTQIAH